MIVCSVCWASDLMFTTKVMLVYKHTSLPPSLSHTGRRGPPTGRKVRDPHEDSGQRL